MKPILSALFSILILSSCMHKTSSSSKLDSLVDGKNNNASHEEIQKDLQRESPFKKRVKLSPEEKVREHTKEEYKIVSIGDLISIYPFTKPLIQKRIEASSKEQGFKENWPEDKIKKLTSGLTKLAIKELIEKRQCFSLDVVSSNSESRDKTYWHAKFIQNKEEHKMVIISSLSDVKASSDTILSKAPFTNSYYTNTYRTLTYYSSIGLCVPKVDLRKTFSIIVEPRFESDLAPIKFEWLEPEK